MKKKKNEHHLDYRSALIQLPLIRESPHGYMRTPEDVVAVCEDMRDLAQEIFQVLIVNARNRLLNRNLIGVGVADSALIHAREVFRNCIVLNAAACILVHNHPSGDPTPSAEDVKLTKQLVQAGSIVGIKVLDHIIVGRSIEGSRGYLSMRESAVVEFDG